MQVGFSPNFTGNYVCCCSNVTVESCNSWEDSPPPYSQLSQTEEDEQSGRPKSATGMLTFKVKDSLYQGEGWFINFPF